MHNGHGHSGFGLTHLVKTMVTCVVVLLIVAPALVDVASRLIPLVLVIGVVAVVLRVVWFYTSRW